MSKSRGGSAYLRSKGFRFKVKQNLGVPRVAQGRLLEGQDIRAIGARVEAGSINHAEEARGWDVLHDRFLTKRINHEECHSNGEAGFGRRIEEGAETPSLVHQSGGKLLQSPPPRWRSVSTSRAATCTSTPQPVVAFAD